MQILYMELPEPMQRAMAEIAMVPEDQAVEQFKRFLYTHGYEWNGYGEGALKPWYLNDKLVGELKKRFLVWYKNHPDVWNEDNAKTPHMWFVMNMIGDLIGWKENPWEWIRE